MEKEVQASLMHHWRFGQSEPDVVGAYCSSVPHEPFHRFLFQLLSVAPLESPPGRPPRAGLVASGLFTISLKGGSWAELLKPARTLVTPHIMGRPPGLPHRHEQQLAVIRAALRLLETADHAPAIETFPS